MSFLSFVGVFLIGAFAVGGWIFAFVSVVGADLLAKDNRRLRNQLEELRRSK